MSTYPGFSAVPGSMEPGRIWPGYGVLAFAGPAPVFALGTPAFRWASGSSVFQWAAGEPYLSWGTGRHVGFGSLGMSHLATQYYLVPVTVTKAGASYNPTSDAVAFAFMPQATQVPGNSDWVTGSWETNTASLLYPYNARCLVGPSGTTTLEIGTYYVYVRITDSPEIPVLIAGQLQIG